MSESIRVLHVEDDPDFADLTATFLQREDDTFSVDSARNGTEGLARLASEHYDGVVSDYDMPGMDGIEFLEAVRENHPQLPFILFTGKGSEEIASEAISAGVTDYLQKGPGTEQFTLLANRARNAVETAQAKAEARQSQERFERLSNVFPDIAFYIDRDGQYVDFIAGESSPLLYDTAEQLMGHRFHDVLPAETADRFLATVRDVLETGTSQTIEYELEVQAGSRWFEAEIVPLRTTLAGRQAVIWVARDITARKERERQLARRNEHIEALHDVTHDLIQLDSREEIAERVVDALDEILEFPLAMVRYYDSEAGGLVPVAYNDYTEEVFERRPVFTPDQDSLSWRAFESGEPVIYDDVNDIETAVDSKTPLRSLMILPLGRHGTLNTGSTRPGEFGENNLISAKILATSAEAALTRIEHTDRLQRQNDRLDKFASLVSHDLRNPLNVAMLRLDLIGDEYESEHLDEIAQAHSRMEQLIEDLLALAQQGETVGETEPLRLADVLRQCWKNVETKRATVESQTEQTVYADRKRLMSVLENLFRNAVEHGSEDVTVTVGDLPDGFYVADDGNGIDADARDRLFESGYSTKPGGTGFGLAIVHEVIDAHGWNVRVTESDRDGARFEITGVDCTR